MFTKSTAPAAGQPVVYLAAIDSTPAGDFVLDLACGVARALPGLAELHIAHVIGPATPEIAALGGASVTTQNIALEQGRKVLDEACAKAREKFGGRVVGHLAAGDPWREIVQLGTSLHADLMVVGTAGRTGVARLALGSVAEKIVRHAGCPVLVARKKDYQEAVPEIEPPCPDCLAVQTATKREQLWCERHSSKHTHGRLHYESPPSFGLGSMLVRP